MSTVIVLIQTEAAWAGRVATGLVRTFTAGGPVNRIEQLERVSVLGGPYDVVLVMSGPDLDYLLELVVDVVQLEPGIVRTLTLPVVTSMAEPDEYRLVYDATPDGALTWTGSADSQDTMVVATDTGDVYEVSDPDETS